MNWTREQFANRLANYQQELAALVFLNRRGSGPRASHLIRLIDTHIEILTDPAYGLTAVPVPHPTCIDVTAVDQTPRSEWICGPECPKEA
jgi:hypothetical protein